MDELNILFEDHWILVIDKPSGCPSQASPKSPKGLYERLKAKYNYVGLHHRLDQPASGLMVFALNPSVNKALSQAFQTKSIRRTYQAVLAGRVKAGSWSSPIEGKPAQTHVNPLASDNGMSAVQFTLDTGRKHQIRLHAAHAEHPIVGDRRYGKQWGRSWPRLALHAHELSLIHPHTREVVTITSTLPTDLHSLWGLAGGPSLTS